MEHTPAMERLHAKAVEDGNEAKIFGFWIYLMTDLIIFAVLFACFIVLHDSTFGGPSGRELFHLPFALVETLLLLVSSFTCSLAILAIHADKKKVALLWLATTFALGAAFLAMEIAEFAQFIGEGANWQRSAFLSSFFTLVGTHGCHIFVGLLWLLWAMFRLYLRPLLESTVSQMVRMALFWHFLDFVWIFIFSVVYGMGSML